MNFAKLYFLIKVVYIIKYNGPRTDPWGHHNPIARPDSYQFNTTGDLIRQIKSVIFKLYKSCSHGDSISFGLLHKVPYQKLFVRLQKLPQPNISIIKTFFLHSEKK